MGIQLLSHRYELNIQLYSMELSTGKLWKKKKKETAGGGTDLPCLHGRQSVQHMCLPEHVNL